MDFRLPAPWILASATSESNSTCSSWTATSKRAAGGSTHGIVGARGKRPGSAVPIRDPPITNIHFPAQNEAGHSLLPYPGEDRRVSTTVYGPLESERRTCTRSRVSKRARLIRSHTLLPTSPKMDIAQYDVVDTVSSSQLSHSLNLLTRLEPPEPLPANVPYDDRFTASRVHLTPCRVLDYRTTCNQ